MSFINNPVSSSSTPATETVAGVVVLGAFSYNTILTGLVVKPPAGATMLQAGDLTLVGDLDLSYGSDICWVD